MAVSVVNAKADVLRAAAALSANCNAAKGLQEVLKSNLGPRGTIKMLVGGAGQVKLTKDGSVLLHEMQIQHPTAAMIARASTAQDEVTGDGTTSNVLLIGELMRNCERYVAEMLHPRTLCEGIEAARVECLRFLDEMRIPLKKAPSGLPEREVLMNVARTALRTKLHGRLADSLAEDLVDAVVILSAPEKKEDGTTTGVPRPIDLHMVEVLHMRHRLANETRLIRGIVMDHGARHPDMPRSLRNCYILTLNVSLEYEKSEVNSGFFYSSAEERSKLVEAERRFTDEKVLKIIELKRQVCTPENGRSFVVLNQKGIDPPSLDLMAKENIIALRRVKRRNMERLMLCCGGSPVNCIEDLSEADLGKADHVYEQTLGEDKFTFVEGVENPSSCTVLIKGPNDHTIAQMKDAVRDGLRAVRNVIEDEVLIPGAGAFEIAAYVKLMEFRKKVSGKKRLGVEAMANALLVIPKTLAANSGLDAQEVVLSLAEKFEGTEQPVGVDVMTGDPISPAMEGIFDTYRVKRQLLSIAPTLAQQLLLVDEVIKAGKSMGGRNN